MKIDGAVQEDDSLQELSTAVDEEKLNEDYRQECLQSVLSHDLRASLAIVNGFSTALGASFQDLSEQYSLILEAEEDVEDSGAADRLMMLEADCRFCLSRLRTSIDQLKHRLLVEHDIDGIAAQEQEA